MQTFPPVRPNRENSETGLLGDLIRTVVRHFGKETEQIKIERTAAGSCFTGIKLDSGAAGLCATPAADRRPGECCRVSGATLPLPASLCGSSAAEILADVGPAESLRRAVVIATLNALLEMLWRREPPLAGACIDAADVLAALNIGPEDHVAMVGAFPSYLRRLRHRTRAFSVLERAPSAFAAEDMSVFVPANLAAGVLPQADVLIITGSTLVNDTLDALLRMARSDARVAVVGPSAPLCPGPYLNRGVSIIGGSRVVTADELLDRLAAGEPGHRLFGERLQRVTLRRTSG